MTYDAKDLANKNIDLHGSILAAARATTLNKSTIKRIRKSTNTKHHSKTLGKLLRGLEQKSQDE
jgi:hypothetical protein